MMWTRSRSVTLRCFITRIVLCRYYAVLVELIVQQLRPGGAALVAGKRYYFGTGGGTQSFAAAAAKHPLLSCEVGLVISDGASNIREVLVITHK